MVDVLSKYVLYMTISLIYADANVAKSAMIVFISLWKLDRAFFSPNGICRYSYIPTGVTKAVLEMESVSTNT